MIKAQITSEAPLSLDTRFDFNMQSYAPESQVSRRTNLCRKLSKLSKRKIAFKPLCVKSRWLLLITNREIDLWKTISIVPSEPMELRTQEVVIDADWSLRFTTKEEIRSAITVTDGTKVLARSVRERSRRRMLIARSHCSWKSFSTVIMQQREWKHCVERLVSHASPRPTGIPLRLSLTLCFSLHI